MNLRRVFLNRDARLRAGWRILLYAAVTAPGAQAAISLYYALGGLGPAGTISQDAGLPGHILFNTLLCAAALLAAFLILRFVDGRSFAALGYGLHGRAAVEIGQGILLGSAMVTAIFAVEAAAGWIRVEPSSPGSSHALRSGLLYVATFASAAALEEILARGYVLQALIQGIGKVPAVLITSLIFGLGHLLNPHAGAFSVLNTALAGVWLGAAYLASRSLWLPTSLHFGWNFVLSYIYGFPVSGLHVSRPLIRLDEQGPDWMTGGPYGPEAGVLGTAAFLAGTMWLLRSRYVRPSPRAEALWTPAPPAAEPETPSPGAAP